MKRFFKYDTAFQLLQLFFLFCRMGIVKSAVFLSITWENECRSIWEITMYNTSTRKWKCLLTVHSLTAHIPYICILHRPPSHDFLRPSLKGGRTCSTWLWFVDDKLKKKKHVIFFPRVSLETSTRTQILPQFVYSSFHYNIKPDRKLQASGKFQHVDLWRNLAGERGKILHWEFMAHLKLCLAQR